MMRASLLLLLLIPWLHAAPAGFRLPSPTVLISAPTNISGAVLWVDASQITGLTNNEPVATVSDLSGAGNILTQATAGVRPLYITNILNGRAILRFDGTDDLLASAASFGSNNTLSGDCEASVFVVYRKSASTKGHILGWGDVNVANASFGVYDDGSIRAWAFAGGQVFYFSSFGTTSFIVREFHKSAGAINTTSISIRNGASDAAGGSASSTPAVDGSQLFCLGRWANSGAYFQGDVAEVVIYNRKLTAAEQSQVRGYLNNKWSVY
jgi:hypothetical protein